MNQTKKLFLFLLVLTICICTNPHKTVKATQTVQKADIVLSLSNTNSDTPCAANTPVNTEFTTERTNPITFTIYTTSKIDMVLEIKNSSRNYVCNQKFNRTDKDWQSESVNEKIGYSRTVSLLSPAIDRYTLKLTFGSATYFIINGVQYYETAAKKVPTLSASNLTLPNGMSQKLSIINNSGKVTWSSTNKSIATVSSTGKIKAKKVGISTIKAKIANGETLTCNLTVVKNEYLGEKKTLRNLNIDQAAINIYKVSYDKKGNIIMKARILNRYDYKISYVKNLKIKLRTNTGKVIATYTAKKAKNANVKANRYKTCSFKIKKSKLKIKTTDLRKIRPPKTANGIPVFTLKA